MVNDYVKGQTMMQYIKEERPVSKQHFWGWCAQLLHQLEQYYRWEDEKAYGGMNPYAVIVTDDGGIRLLDVDDFDNQELVKRMQKKNVRVLFVKWEHAFSRKADREDDSYGLGKTFQFMAEKCHIEGNFTRKEERTFRRVICRCLDGKAAEIKGLKELQREVRVLREGKMQGRTEKLSKDAEKCETWTGQTKVAEGWGKIKGKKVFLFIIVIAIVTGSVVWWKDYKEKREGLKTTEFLDVDLGSGVSEESQDGMTKQKGEEAKEPDDQEALDKKEPKVIGVDWESRLWLELGLLYCGELEEYGRGITYLETAAETFPLAEVYLAMETYIQKRGDENQVKRKLEQVVESGRKELESEEESTWTVGKEYVYEMPFLEAYRILDTKESWQEAVKVAEKLKEVESWGKGADAKEKEQNIREYLAKAYEMLEQPEKAVEEYERIKELESDTSGMVVLYLKLEDLYEELGDAENAWNICRESVERVPESEQVWLTYIERHLRDNGIERAVCAEAVKKAVTVLPELKQNSEFQKLLTEYGIKMEGEEVWIGE